MVRIAVIGGGIAGLSCASRLQELLGATSRVTVYDTGKRGPGGRASSRLWQDDASRPVDHAVQFAEAHTTAFSHFMEGLAQAGTVRRLSSEDVTILSAPNQCNPVGDGVARFVGVGGMGAIADALASGLDDVRQDVWVSPNGGIRKGTRDGPWLVRESKTVEASYDAIVIAHNGKCAERLTSRQPARAVHALLRARFAARLGNGGSGGASGRMTLNSIYSLLFEVPKGVMPDTLSTCSFVRCEPQLMFLSNNAAKHASVDTSHGTEVWTALSSAAFGAEYKAPQEHIEGTDVEVEVTANLLQAVSRAAGLPEDALRASVVASKLQLWGAAVPINTWTGGSFAWDASEDIGVAGDWFATEGAAPSTIESAWLSGRLLAEHVATSPEGEGTSVGIELGEAGGRFVPSNAGGFGDERHSSKTATDAGKWVAPMDATGAGKSSKSGPSRAKGSRPAPSSATDCLFVRNLPYTASEEDIRQHFESIGASVRRVSILQDATGRPRGLARVEMRSVDEAKQAVEKMDGVSLGGRSLRVAFNVRQASPSRG